MFPGPICLYPKPVALLSTLIVLSKLRARMVNFNNPATIALDSGACAIPSGQGIRSFGDLPVDLFHRGGREVVASYGWCIYVSLRGPPRWPTLLD